MPSFCGLCKARTKRTDLICNICKLNYHLSCVEVTAEELSNYQVLLNTWVCKSCKTSKINNTENPIPNLNQQQTPKQTIQIPDENSVHFDSSAIATQLSDIKKMIDAMFQTQIDLKTTVDDIKQQNYNFHEKYNTLEKRINVAEKKNLEYERRISELERQLDIPKQEENACNIIISGLPLVQQNQKIDMVVKVLNKVQATVNLNDIDDVTIIIPKRNTNIGNGEESGTTNSSPLYLVKFKTPAIQLEVLTKKKTFKHLFTSDIELQNVNNNNEIFFRNHFTPYQSKLYKAGS